MLNMLFELPVLLTLSGDTVTIVNKCDAIGTGCIGGCTGGCNSGCFPGSGSGPKADPTAGSGGGIS
jgi:hypothetical protein